MNLFLRSLLLAAALLPACCEAVPQIPSPGQGAPRSPRPQAYTFEPFPHGDVARAWRQEVASRCTRAEVRRVWYGATKREEVCELRGEELKPFLDLLVQVPQFYFRKRHGNDIRITPAYRIFVSFYGADGKRIDCISSASRKVDVEEFYADVSGRPVRLISLFDTCLPKPR